MLPLNRWPRSFFDTFHCLGTLNMASTGTCARPQLVSHRRGGRNPYATVSRGFTVLPRLHTGGRAYSGLCEQ